MSKDNNNFIFINMKRVKQFFYLNKNKYLLDYECFFVVVNKSCYIKESEIRKSNDLQVSGD